MVRRLAYACLIGCPLAIVVDGAIRQQPIESDLLRYTLAILALPGGLISVLFSRGNIHAYSLRVVSVANAIVYSALVFWILTFVEKRQSRRRKRVQT